MKTFLKVIIVTGVILVSVACAVFWLSARERSLATEFAAEKLTEILKDAKSKTDMGIPSDTRLVSHKPGDTDLFERTWIFWFKLEPEGSIMISIVAKRGISFFPLLNTRETLEVHRIDYKP